MSEPINPIFLAKTWTTEYLRDLREAGIPENEQLDFKRAPSLPLRKKSCKDQKAREEREERIVEMTRDVTAFANAGGGVLLYGAAEIKRDGEPVLEKFDPIDPAEQSVEDIERLLQGNLGAMLPRFQVISIPCPDEEASRCFAIIVWSSHTAHMARDGCYYYRHGTSKIRMSDWQVRDAMNRSQTPMLSFALHWELAHGNNGPNYGLKFVLRNEGPVGADHWLMRLDLPAQIDKWPLDYYCYEIPHCHSSSPVKVTEGSLHYRRLEIRNMPANYLFPGSVVQFRVEMRVEKVLLEHWRNGRVSDEVVGCPSLEKFRVTLFADNMPQRELTLPTTQFHTQSQSNYILMHGDDGQRCHFLNFLP